MNQILASFLFCSVLQYQVTEATFNFFDEPENVTVEVMGTAIFNCTYNSTRSSTFDWLINDTTYSLVSRLPRNHYSSGTVNGFSLMVYNVQNTASYGCEIRDSSNTYTSQIGYLCVKEADVITTITERTNPPSIVTEIANTDYENSTLERSDVDKNDTDAYENSTVENSTVENSTVENSSVDKKKGAPSEIIIIIVGVVSSLVVSTVLYCSIILLGISCHKKYFASNCQTAEVKTDELTPSTPIYEEIEDIVLAVGASNKEQVFDMHECDAYIVA